MTDIQLRYWGLQEEKRHNLVWEQETHEHNAAEIELGWANNKANMIQAYASQTHAAAAMRNAVAYENLTNHQAGLMDAQAENYRAQTVGLGYDNTVKKWSVPGDILSHYTRPAKDISQIVKDVMGFQKKDSGPKGLFDDQPIFTQEQREQLWRVQHDLGLDQEPLWRL